ncbi:MAG TPA: HEAT repeat domain-containing protein [Candidatus Angelobacter sp.]
MKAYLTAAILCLAPVLGHAGTQAASTAPEPESKEPPVRIGEIDFFGYAGLDIKRVRAALPIHQDQELSPSALSEAKANIQEAVQQVTGHPVTDIAGVCCDGNGHSMLYIGLAGRSSKAISFNPPPSGSIRLPETAIKLYESVMDAWSKAVQSGANGEDRSKGYSLLNDPDTRAKQLAMRDYTLQHQALVLEVLESSANSQDRAAAAEMLGYADQSQQQIDALVHASRDPDAGVRNNVVRALLVLAGSGEKTAALIPAAPFVDMLNSGSWLDRNKAGGLLLELTKSRDPKLLAELRSRALPSLFEMAQWQETGHAYEYRFILGRIAGLEEGQIEKLSRQNDQGKALVAAVRQALRPKAAPPEAK